MKELVKQLPSKFLIYIRDNGKCIKKTVINRAQIFWTKVISEYTKGQFKERLENGKRIQNFEN